LPENRESHSTLQKAFAVIKLLVETGYPMNAPDIGAQLDMNRQTVHRLLNQLEAIGMVRRDVARERFEIGPALVQLGLRAQNGNHTANLRRAVMQKLVDEVDENCNLGVLDGHEIVYINHVECRWPLRRQMEVGTRLPAYCTGIGKVLLAHLPEKTLEQYLSVAELKPQTEHSWTDPEAFREHLAEIREQGYAIGNQENLIGLLSIAVPVPDPLGRVVAGLSIHGPVTRLPEDRARAFVPMLQEAAQTISELMIESASRRLTT
jgi:DNA-binding IclR family transcriptional regulator